MLPVALDTGSAITKVGFAGQNFPVEAYPTAVGRPLLTRGTEFIDLGEGIDLDDELVGQEMQLARGTLDENFPMRSGIVKDWDDMELVWRYGFYQSLHIDPRETMLLTTEPPFNPLSNREKLVEVMLETFGFSHLYLAVEAILVLFTQGLITGIAVDCGEGTTTGVPVYEGTVLPHSSRRFNVAGRDVTMYLVNLLRRRGYHFNEIADFHTVETIKKKLCYTCCDIKLEKKLALETCFLEQKFQLPDKSEIVIGAERFQAPEVLFNPDLLDKETLGLSDLVYKVAQTSAIDVRRDLYAHVVLSGGSTLFPGLPTRLTNDLKQMYLKHQLKGDKSKLAEWKLRVEDVPVRKNLVWMGAAVFAEILQQDKSQWISQQDWAEEGAKVILEKCPTRFDFTKTHGPKDG